MDPDRNAPPINPLPPVVWLLVLPIAAIELVLSAASAGTIGGREAVGWRNEVIEGYGFFGTIYDWMRANHRLLPTELVRFVSYPFVQWNAGQAVFGAALILALGKFVGEVFRGWAVLAVFLGAAVAGALVYGEVLDDRVPLVGAYPAAYGLIGAFTYILWTRLGERGANRSRAFVLIGMLLLFQAVFGAFNWLYHGSSDGYWVADLAGFAAGFLLSFVVSPGGWQTLLRRVRQG